MTSFRAAKLVYQCPKNALKITSRILNQCGGRIAGSALSNNLNSVANDISPRVCLPKKIVAMSNAFAVNLRKGWIDYLRERIEQTSSSVVVFRIVDDCCTSLLGASRDQLNIGQFHLPSIGGARIGGAP